MEPSPGAPQRLGSGLGWQSESGGLSDRPASSLPLRDAPERAATWPSAGAMGDVSRIKLVGRWRGISGCTDSPQSGGAGEVRREAGANEAP